MKTLNFFFSLIIGLISIPNLFGTEITHVGLAAPNIMELVIRTGRVEIGIQCPYVEKPGDQIKKYGTNVFLIRNNKNYGTLVGTKHKILRPFDRMAEPVMEQTRLDDKDAYSVHPAGKPSSDLIPTAVYRKSKPFAIARVDSWKFQLPVEHHVFLVFDQLFIENESYEISFQQDFLPKQTFRFSSVTTRSESIHASQIGFHPNDPSKTTYLSCWMGNGGGVPYKDDFHFQLVENNSSKVVYEGKGHLSKRASQKDEDAYKRNFNLTDVYEMDFSDFNTPGTYRIVIPGLGCSYPFDIDAQVWKKAFTISARGFYHQRSGIELGPPYTDFHRPRPFYPGDGVKVYASTTRLMDSRNGLSDTDPNNFRNLVAGITSETVANAWGGYMDAGDWDRRIQHLISSVYLLELANLFPDYFSSLSLNIPESGNDLPDIVDEALFNLDCYRRMQTPDGGIRGGIESEEHPNIGESSWQESLRVMAYAPGSWSSFYYAGVAARAACVLEKLNKPKRAEIYKKSALKAMNWAENDYAHKEDRAPSYTVNGVKVDRMDNRPEVKDARNYAAAELFRLTGDPKWNTIFKQTTALNKPNVDLYVWKDHSQANAAWVYAKTNKPGIDKKLQQYCVDAIVKEAKQRLATEERTAFHWSKNDWAPPTTTLSSSDSISLIRAHNLTGDPAYLKGIVLACQAGAGANPLNLCYTTRAGQNWPHHPLHLDSRHTGQLPPEGLTVFGPVDSVANKDNFGQKIAAQALFPAPEEWPIMEAYWDIFWYPVMNEFTIQHPMAQNAYTWGYLAACHPVP